MAAPHVTGAIALLLLSGLARLQNTAEWPTASQLQPPSVRAPKTTTAYGLPARDMVSSMWRRSTDAF